MAYIDLNSITREHLLGNWQIEKRFGGSGGTESIFDKCHSLVFESGGGFTAQNGGNTRGTWELIKEQEVIYNPQVIFFQGAEKIGNSIITRLLNVTEGEQNIFRLTLYFTNGLELILKRQ